MTCEKCGAELVVGSWPFCPHQNVNEEGLGMLGEFRPRWEENMGPEPVYITSLAQKQALLRDADGTRGYRLEERDPRLTKSQAIERMMARRERAEKDARARA